MIGLIKSAQNGFPLQGIRIQVVFPEEPAEIVIGEAVSDARGRFRIVFRDSRQARQRLCLIQKCGASYRIKAVSTAGAPTLTVARVQAGRRTSDDVIVYINVPRTAVPTAVWNTIGTRLDGAGIHQLNELIRHLTILDSGQSIFSDVPLEIRHSAAAELESAFLDPEDVLKPFGPIPSLTELSTPEAVNAYVSPIAGKATDPRVLKALGELSAKASAFASIAAVDWVIDTKELAAGKPKLAATKYQPSYTNVNIGMLSSGQVLVAVIDQNLVNYRNYLRTIFTGPPGAVNYAEYRVQLTRRFHQDFTTNNTTSTSANSLAIGIMKTILTAPSGAGYGFGIAANTIPSLGQQSNRDYLDALIKLCNVPQNELELRYRLNLHRDDNEQSSRVQENIYTLQRFYSDGFQNAADPFPIIPGAVLGKTPFYLEYEEWYRLNGPFYGENYYQIRQTFWFDFDEQRRKTIASYVKSPASSPSKFSKDPTYDGARWLSGLLSIDDSMQEAHRKLDLGLYTQARDFYVEALKKAEDALQVAFTKIDDNPLDSYLVEQQKKSLTPDEIVASVANQFAELKATTVESPDDLDETIFSQNFINYFRIYYFHYGSIFDDDWHILEFLDWAANEHDRHVFVLLHLYLYVIPTCLGDTAMAAGDYMQAESFYALTTGLVLGKGSLTNHTGYQQREAIDYFTYPENVHDADDFAELLENGPLPYSVDVSKNPGFDLPAPLSVRLLTTMAALVVRTKTHPMERKFFALRHASALLEWADALYRTADASSIARARELYKAVLILHKWPTGLAPNWGVPTLMPGFSNHKVNPAIVSQVGRAQRMLLQIENRLNYYGYDDDAVPALRYRPLKDGADRFVAAAKAAESDYLRAVSKIEDAVKEGIITANMLKKAQLQAQIADEQKGLADYDIMLAQRQFDQVQTAIDAKKKEIADHDGLGQQFLDFFGGFADSLTSLPSGLTAGLGEGAAGGFGLSAASETGGLFGGGGWLGLGAGASAGGAFGLFIYAGVSGIMSAGNAQNARAADLQTLEEQALPLAEAQLTAKGHEANIATLHKQIALADADLTMALFHFLATRNLTTEFWAAIAAVLKRVLRRYLELAAKFAWLAERALSYEQGRTLGIIRFDYFPSKLYDVTGADLLALDLAEVEAAGLEGVRQTVPVKQTYSLAFDFPLAFASLKKTGKCAFRVDEAALHVSYPGLYGYRIRAVSVAVQTASPTGAIRGVLMNNGVSLISRSDGSTHVSARMPEGFPLSEFRIAKDFAVYSLPNESLMNFEGSGLDSYWNIDLPQAANSYGLDSVADILITFDVIARYSAELYKKHVAQMPVTVRKFVLVSAIAQSSHTLDDLKGGAVTANIAWDMTEAKLSSKENNRKVKNMVVFFAGASPNLTAALSCPTPATQAPNVVFTTGITMSNLAPLGDTKPAPPPPAPLNVFVDHTVDQAFTMTVTKAANQGVDFSKVTDVVLGLEYTADL